MVAFAYGHRSVAQAAQSLDIAVLDILAVVVVAHFRPAVLHGYDAVAVACQPQFTGSPFRYARYVCVGYIIGKRSQRLGGRSLHRAMRNPVEQHYTECGYRQPEVSSVAGIHRVNSATGQPPVQNRHYRER